MSSFDCNINPNVMGPTLTNMPFCSGKLSRNEMVYLCALWVGACEGWGWKGEKQIFMRKSRIALSRIWMQWVSLFLLISKIAHINCLWNSPNSHPSLERKSVNIVCEFWLCIPDVNWEAFFSFFFNLILFIWQILSPSNSFCRYCFKVCSLGCFLHQLCLCHCCGTGKAGCHTKAGYFQWEMNRVRPSSAPQTGE